MNDYTFSILMQIHPGGTGLARTIMSHAGFYSMTEMVVTTKAVRCTELQPKLSPPTNQQPTFWHSLCPSCLSTNSGKALISSVARYRVLNLTVVSGQLVRLKISAQTGQIYIYVLFTDPRPSIFGSRTELGNRLCPVFRRADLATLQMGKLNVKSLPFSAIVG